MPNTLLAWIGTKDLEASEGKLSAGLGPIAQAIDSLGFDKIVLLYNQPPAKVDHYVDWLRARIAEQVEAHHEGLSSPTNYEEIYKAAFRVISNILKRGGPATKLTFHISPGTPAMSS